MDMPDPKRTSISVLDQLYAIKAALAEPRRLVDAISDADDDEQAVDAVIREFQLSPQAARAVMDQQFRHLTRAALAALQRDIARAQAEESPETPRHNA
jgi:DNA gyrase/topoisomerase IV subunit A